MLIGFILNFTYLAYVVLRCEKRGFFSTKQELKMVFFKLDYPTSMPQLQFVLAVQAQP